MAGTVVFDLDGTLIDSVPDLAAAVDRMLVELGRPPAGVEKVRDWIGNGALVLVRRALAQACMRAGGERPTHERLTALHELASGHGEAGPVQMAGRVAAYRRRPSCGGGRAGTLELVLQPR